VPTTFDELANFMRRYKQDNPTSYPLTQYYGPRIMNRMIQHSWGFHANRNAVSRVLSYDYSRNTYFAGAISDQYRDFMRFWSKLYAEGLIDPEIAEPISDDSWARKLANGTSIATYAWYDQIGGITAASTIPGFKLNLYPPLRGPVGAHHVPQSKTAGGPIFPIATSQRADFERVVRAVDTMFFSKEAETLWCLGVEGQTYTMQGNTVNFIPSLVNSPDGVYKAGQLQYGIGVGGLQYLWVNAREMTKYDDYYAQLNNTVAAMPNAIRSTAPSPKYPDTPAGIRDAERADALMMTLWDIYVVWDNNFLTGAKSIESDWNAFVNEMTSSGINEFLTLYNNNLQR
jgi:putative aldouronate transport system substrate-binding protein